MFNEKGNYPKLKKKGHNDKEGNALFSREFLVKAMRKKKV